MDLRIPDNILTIRLYFFGIKRNNNFLDKSLDYLHQYL
jgi:hypothetical protein